MPTMTHDRAADPRLAALEVLRKRLCATDQHTDVEGRPARPANTAALLAAHCPDGTWPDVDYANAHLKDWDTARHLSRLQTLARAWHQPDSPLHGRGDVLRAILRGLDAWYARNPQNPNWWWNQIGAPQLLGSILLFVKDVCTRSHIERAVPAFTAHEPASRFTGQNLVWVAGIALVHGLLTDDPERVSRAYVLIGKEVRIFPDDEGIQPDLSFHQHGKLLYSGGYGQGFAADVARLMAVAAGTPFAWPPELVARHVAFVLDGCAWMVRGCTFEPGACGREITRQGHSASRFRTGLRHLASFPHARQTEAAAMAAADPAAGRSLVTGNRHFWCSDLMVHHRPAWYASVRVPSPRVVNADWPCCGGEGRLCHYLADGATFLLRDGDEYRDLYPVWNWRQIPGTTVVQETGEFAADTLRAFGERAFAGGASDGQVGCMAVDLARGPLTARKAWFLFDEGMVALGAGITATADAPVRTTLNQCLWRGPARLAGSPVALGAGEYPLAPGSAFCHDAFVYRVLDGTGTLRLGTQSGAWSDCGVGSPERLTLNVLNAGLDHGVRPGGATYAYAVLAAGAPAAGAADSADRFAVVANTAALQAAWDTGAGRGHAVFYEPGTVRFPDGQGLGVDRPCILLYAPRHDGTVVLTLAQPEQQEGVLTVTLDGPARVTLGVSMPPGVYAGASQTLVWRGEFTR